MSIIKYHLLKRLCEVNRLNQDFPGRWRLCRWLTEQNSSILAYFKAGPVKVADRTYLHLDPAEPYDGLKTIIHGLNIREPLTNIIRQLLMPGDCFLDIGANVGYFSALASLTVGENGQVLSFEAAPSTYQRLQVLANNNLFNNIKTFNCAVSDTNGEVEFHCGPSDHTGIASMRELGIKASSTIKVQAICLDNILKEIPPVRLIKIDVEGAEMLVSLGMKHLLQRDKPYIIVEVTDGFLRQLGSNKYELVNYFCDLGYSPFRIQIPLDSYKHKDEYQCDVLFVHQSNPITNFNEKIYHINWGAIGK